MSVPDLFNLASGVFHSLPEKVARLRQLCDETDRMREEHGEDYPGVQSGERAVNALKGEFTRRIAWACHQQDPRFGLRLKLTGQIATRPADGVRHSTDALMMRDDGQIIDAMSDRDVSWGVTPGDTQPKEEWLEPLPEVGDVPAPGPGPIAVTPPPADLSLLLRVEQLEQSVETLWTHLAGAIDTLNEQGRALSGYQLRLLQLEDYARKGIVLPELPPLEAVGKLNVFGHAVDIRLPVQKKE